MQLRKIDPVTVIAQHDNVSKTPGTKMKRLILLALLAFPGTGFAQSHSLNGEQVFIDALENYDAEYAHAQTNAERDQIIENRRAGMCQYSATTYPWTGVVNKIVQEADGSLAIVVQISPDIYLMSAYEINPHLPSFSGVLNTKVGDTVHFTADFVVDGNCASDLNETKTAMTTPQILTNILSIGPAAKP